VTRCNYRSLIVKVKGKRSVMDMENEGQAPQIEYNVGKNNWFFSAPTLAAVVISTAIIVYFAIYMIGDPSIVSKVAGIIACTLYVGYISYYFVMYIHSRRYTTQKAVLTGEYLESYCKDGIKRFALSDIVFSMSYSSSSKLCVITATESDYMVLNCSCSYLFTKGGKEIITPFYELNSFFKNYNDKHVDYIKNRRYGKRNPFNVPHFVFEIEFYTKKAKKFIGKVRDSFPARAGVFERRANWMGKAGYRAKVVGIGGSALSFLEHKMVVFFDHKCGPDLAEYSVLLDGGGVCDFEPGDHLILGDERYQILAVGEVANKNLEALGHAVIKFDGKTSAELPGCFHVEAKEIVEITTGLSVVFC